MSIKIILVPFDFSPGSTLALEKACQLGQQLKAELHLVHVKEGRSDPSAQQHLLDKLLTVIPPSYEMQNKVTREVLSGSVYDAIIQHAKKMQADLIVMGSRGRTGILAMAMGSVAQRVLRMSACPVVLVATETQPTENTTDSESDTQYESLKSSDSSAMDLLARAISLRSTDVHIDPLDDSEYSIRFRVDGELVTYCTVDHSVAEHLMHQYLTLARIDHAEPFRPREGRLMLPPRMRDMEARVTAAPVAGGSAMALRLFVKENATLPLENLGFGDGAIKTVQRMLHGSEGLVLVTGPTGSGKTTTVYSMLRTYGDKNRNIVSIEDPVEFDVPYVRQMSVDERHDVTMTTGLRTLLRMDPDIVFLGEIRDPENAGIAMRAASSGRFVFSSLHTRDVASTITCLRDMLVANHSISGNLAGVVNQRLIRRLCVQCRKSVAPDEDCKTAFTALGLSLPTEVFDAQGCDACRGTGYRGRCGVFECVAMDDRLAQAIASNASETELRQQIRSQGVASLMEDSMRKVYDGVTSFEEAKSSRWI